MRLGPLHKGDMRCRTQLAAHLGHSTYVLAEKQNMMPVTNLPLHALLHAPGQTAQGTFKVKQTALSPSGDTSFQCPLEEQTWLPLWPELAYGRPASAACCMHLPSADGVLVMYTGMGTKQIDPILCRRLQVWS